jgi:hypothetical protein
VCWPGHVASDEDSQRTKGASLANDAFSWCACCGRKVKLEKRLSATLFREAFRVADLSFVPRHGCNCFSRTNVWGTCVVQHLDCSCSEKETEERLTVLGFLTGEFRFVRLE